METGDAAEWLLHAESDLTYAKLGQVQPAILRNQVAFHAEQAAEKAFKAVLVHAAHPLFGHNVLLGRCLVYFSVLPDLFGRFAGSIVRSKRRAAWFGPDKFSAPVA